MALTIYDLVDELLNENEPAVMDLVNQYQIEGKLPCTCRECLLDVTALALNYLEPRYSVSLLKDLYVKEADQLRLDDTIKQAVEDAAEKVKARPHHFD